MSTVNILTQKSVLNQAGLLINAVNSYDPHKLVAKSARGNILPLCIIPDSMDFEISPVKYWLTMVNVTVSRISRG